MSEPVTVDTVLAPVDGSEESITAVEYAVAVADAHDAAVHVVYVLGEEVVRGLESDTIDERSVADDTEAFLDTAVEITDRRDVPAATSTASGFSIRRKTRHPGNAVLDCAEEVDADFIVLPRESTPEASKVLDRAAEHVLLYASQPVLSV